MAEFAGKVAWSVRCSLLPTIGTFVVDIDSTLMMDPVGDLDLGQAVFQVETSSAQILFLIIKAIAVPIEVVTIVVVLP